MKQIQSPNAISYATGTTIFLAGSIEMGTAENWQSKLIEKFKDADVTFLNPRRDDWDSSWEQSIENPEFHQQVSWELNSIDKADIVVFYFDPNTKSPITLMELGYVLGAKKDNVIVCCPDGFWRKGNVDIMCERAGTMVLADIETLAVALQLHIED